MIVYLNLEKTKRNKKFKIIKKNSTGQLEPEEGEFDLIPIYLIARYNFYMVSNFTPYLKANLGYSFNLNPSDLKLSFTVTNESGKSETEVDNVLCWAIGGGMEWNTIILK